MVLLVPSAVWKCPVADNLLCPYAGFKKKKHLIMGSLYTTYQDALGLLNYLSLVNNYPTEKAASVRIASERVHLTQGVFASTATNWITGVKTHGASMIKTTFGDPLQNTFNLSEARRDFPS